MLSKTLPLNLLLVPTLPFLEEATETGAGWKHFLSRKELNPPHSIVQVSLLEPVDFQVFLRHPLMLCLTRGHDSESSSHDYDQSCTKVESTSLKEPASETFDTITNSATTPKLTQVDANSGHESGPPTLAS